MVRVAGIVFCLFCLLTVVGCSQYDDNYQYSPRPLTADIPATQPQQPPAVSTTVTIVGVRYGDEDNHIPASIEIRMRMDNNGPDAVVFDPMSMQMSTAQLVRLGTPIVRPPTPINVGAAQSAYLTAYFPFPAGSNYDSLDLSALQLRWQLQLGPRPVGQVANFTRVWPSYYYSPGPYYYYGPPPPYYYGGVIVVHRRW